MGFWHDIQNEAIPFILTIILLVVAAGYIIRVHHIVRFRSGLDDTDILRSKWSKSDQIIFQNFRAPLLLSVLIGAGVGLMFVRLISVFFEVLDIVHMQRASPTLDLVLWLLGYALGTVAALFVYGIANGSNLLIQAALLVVVDTGIYALHTANRHEPLLYNVVLMLIGLVAIRGSIAYFGQQLINNYLVYASQRSSQSSQASVEFCFKLEPMLYILLAYGLKLATIKFSGADNEEKGLPPLYFARTGESFSKLLVLLSCAAASIYVTNALLMNNRESWQWSSVLNVAVPITILESALLVWRILDVHYSGVFEAYLFIRNIMLASATGYVASFAYLGVVALYARKALNVGMHGQTELLEESDEEEYEV